VKKRMMCKKFDKLIKKIKTAVYNTSALSSMIREHKIVIYLFEKYIIKNEEQ